LTSVGEVGGSDTGIGRHRARRAKGQVSLLFQDCTTGIQHERDRAEVVGKEIFEPACILHRDGLPGKGIIFFNRIACGFHCPAEVVVGYGRPLRQLIRIGDMTGEDVLAGRRRVGRGKTIESVWNKKSQRRGCLWLFLLFSCTYYAID
jgi:hypothetical protein